MFPRRSRQKVHCELSAPVFSIQHIRGMMMADSGFDPERIASLVERVRNMQATEHHPAMAEFWAEIAAAFDCLTTEMARRDENERQNCLNWGPCTRMNRAALESAAIAQATTQKGSDNA
jgi:hypothetical protein